MWQTYKTYFSDKKFIISFLSGMVLLAASLVTQFYISIYVNRSASSSVTDIILSNTRVYDVSVIFVWGAILLVAIGAFIALNKPNRAPFLMKSIAVFTFIRSVFISLTHISPFPTRVVIDSPFFNREVFNGIFTGNDLFFSGHTGIPFLLALIFWEDEMLRFIFLAFSVMFAIVVLLGHLHYSIDVLSAYFITFSIFHICKFLFKKDWKLFLKKEDETL
ncbi:MAG: phosphatase PAP2-related protein [Candidatus Pacebacteria bacterium]|nr:phosphatase PAP2-related protein [Candidatus Paceibacterota bacterium]